MPCILNSHEERTGRLEGHGEQCLEHVKSCRVKTAIYKVIITFMLLARAA